MSTIQSHNTTPSSTVHSAKKAPPPTQTQPEAKPSDQVQVSQEGRQKITSAVNLPGNLLNMGQTTPQSLIDSLEPEKGTTTVKSGRQAGLVQETRTLDKQVSNAHGVTTTSYYGADHASLTSRESKGKPTEWNYSKETQNEQGDKVINSQTFFQGIPNLTSVKQQTYSQDGQRLQEKSVSDNRYVSEKGGSLTSKSQDGKITTMPKIPQRMESERNVDLKAQWGDFEAVLGKEEAAKLKDNPAYQQILQDFGSGDFQLTDLKESSTFQGKTTSTEVRGGRGFSSSSQSERTEEQQFIQLEKEDGSSAIFTRGSDEQRPQFFYRDKNGNEFASAIGADGERVTLTPDKFQGDSKPSYASADASKVIGQSKFYMDVGSKAAVPTLAKFAEAAEKLGSTSGMAGRALDASDFLTQNTPGLFKAIEPLSFALHSTTALQAMGKGDYGGAADAASGQFADLAGITSSIDDAITPGAQGGGSLQVAGRSLNLSDEALTHFSKFNQAGKFLGGVGGVYQVGKGLHGIGTGDVDKGVFDTMGGAGALVLIAGGSNPVGWGLAVAGGAGGMMVDHRDSTGLAPQYGNPQQLLGDLKSP